MPTALSVVKKFFPNVTDVKDAGRSARLEVTGADNSAGKRMSHKTCALAVACKKKYELDGVIISIKTAYLVKGDVAKRYQVPESVSREVVSFDRNGEFAAGEYHLDKIQESRRLGAKPKGTKHGAHAGKHRTPRHVTQGIRAVLGGAK